MKAHGQGHGAPGIEPVSLPIPPEGLGLDGLGAARSGAPEGARKKTRGASPGAALRPRIKKCQPQAARRSRARDRYRMAEIRLRGSVSAARG